MWSTYFLRYFARLARPENVHGEIRNGAVRSAGNADSLLCRASRLRPGRELWCEITRETTRRKLLITRFCTDVSRFRLSTVIADSFRNVVLLIIPLIHAGNMVIFTASFFVRRSKTWRSFRNVEKLPKNVTILINSLCVKSNSDLIR